MQVIDLRTAVLTFRDLVEAIPIEDGMERSPEFELAARYLSRLDRTFGKEAVRSTIRRVLGIDLTARVH